MPDIDFIEFCTPISKVQVDAQKYCSFDSHEPLFWGCSETYTVVMYSTIR